MSKLNYRELASELFVIGAVAAATGSEALQSAVNDLHYDIKSVALELMDRFVTIDVRTANSPTPVEISFDVRDSEATHL